MEIGRRAPGDASTLLEERVEEARDAVVLLELRPDREDGREGAADLVAREEVVVVVAVEKEKKRKDSGEAKRERRNEPVCELPVRVCPRPPAGPEYSVPPSRRIASKPGSAFFELRWGGRETEKRARRTTGRRRRKSARQRREPATANASATTRRRPMPMTARTNGD
jgi:hypothetical protein